MKRLLTLFLVLWCSTAWAVEPIDLARGFNPYVAGAGVAAGVSCTTSNDGVLAEPVTQPGTGNSDMQWTCLKFTLAAQKTITAYKILECDNNSDTGNTRVQILNHDAANDYPDDTSLVSNTNVSMNMSSVSNCATKQTSEYNLATPQVLASGTYWVCSLAENSANRFVFYETSTGNRACYSSNTGVTWTCIANTAYDMEVWGCD